MTLTDAQKQALDKLPLTFSTKDDLKTVDGVQWRTIRSSTPKDWSATDTGG